MEEREKKFEGDKQKKKKEGDSGKPNMACTKICSKIQYVLSSIPN